MFLVLYIYYVLLEEMYTPTPRIVSADYVFWKRCTTPVSSRDFQQSWRCGKLELIHQKCKCFTLQNTWCLIRVSSRPLLKSRIKVGFKI